jgi:DNA-binding transcriptional ArsR family regulator
MTVTSEAPFRLPERPLEVDIVAKYFRGLGDSTRLRILELVADGERSVGELVERISLTQPGVSKHLRVLRDAGLVRVRVDAQRRLYGIRPEPLSEIDAWLQPYRHLWADRLDALERHLDATEGG